MKLLIVIFKRGIDEDEIISFSHFLLAKINLTDKYVKVWGKWTLPYTVPGGVIWYNLENTG